jgi:hypothetical protein
LFFFFKKKKKNRKSKEESGGLRATPIPWGWLHASSLANGVVIRLSAWVGSGLQATPPLGWPTSHPRWSRGLNTATPATFRGGLQASPHPAATPCPFFFLKKKIIIIIFKILIFNCNIFNIFTIFFY